MRQLFQLRRHSARVTLRPVQATLQLKSVSVASLATVHRLLNDAARRSFAKRATDSAQPTTPKAKSSKKAAKSAAKAAPEAMRARAQELRQELERHSQLYAQGKPEISDAAWDNLYAELNALENECPALRTPSSPTQRVADKVQKSSAIKFSLSII